MAAKPLDHIHIVGIVAEWLVAYWKRTRTRFESQRGTNQPTTLTGIVPECRLWRAAKPGPRRGAVQRPTLNNQAASKMLGLHTPITVHVAREVAVFHALTHGRETQRTAK